jgi:hypothetical protein
MKFTINPINALKFILNEDKCKEMRIHAVQ